ncbi:MAG: zinc-finger protein [Pycnora praestabilis]|nr:MAG: zinc-finger protein [Pycnora praestabilis]
MAAVNLVTTSWDTLLQPRFPHFLGESETTSGGYSFPCWGPVPTTKPDVPPSTSNRPCCMLENGDHPRHAIVYPYPRDTSEYHYPPAKRRKGSPNEQLPGQYMTGTIQPQQSQQEIDAGGNALHCHWGNSCEEELYDFSALDEHIHVSHVKPRTSINCKWDKCEEPTDPSMILNHVKRNHTSDEEHVCLEEHICLWAGCNARFCDHEDLERHFQTEHVPPSNALYCEWDQCGARADGPNDLSVHLQTDHFLDQVPTSLSGPSSTSQTPTLSSEDSSYKTCEWIDDMMGGEERKGCGMTFDDPNMLQQHVKDAHVHELKKKKAALTCHWTSCARERTQPFSQRLKLERHIQVHTGCKQHLQYKFREI